MINTLSLIMEVVNQDSQEFIQYDISHLRRGDPHPWKETHVLGSWLTGLDGKRTPHWVRKNSFKPRRWTNQKDYMDTVIISRPNPLYEKICPEPSPIRPQSTYVSGVLANKRAKCRDKGLPFDLNKDNIPPIPETCPALGIPIVPWNGKLTAHTATLDRIFPDRGYVASNLIWVSHKANCIKTNATWQEIQKVADFYRNLVPDIPERFDNPPIDLTPIIRPPEPEKPRPPVPAPSEWDLKYCWICEETEWRKLAKMDNQFGHALGSLYHQIWKKENSWEMKTAKYQAQISDALAQWKQRHFGRGIFSIRPADFQKELSQFFPSIEAMQISVFGQFALAVMRKDPAFMGTCENLGSRAYKMNI